MKTILVVIIFVFTFQPISAQDSLCMRIAIEIGNQLGTCDSVTRLIYNVEYHIKKRLEDLILLSGKPKLNIVRIFQEKRDMLKAILTTEQYNAYKQLYEGKDKTKEQALMKICKSDPEVKPSSPDNLHVLQAMSPM